MPAKHAAALQALEPQAGGRPFGTERRGQISGRGRHVRAGADALRVTIEGEEGEAVERMKGVVASHLDRFAFREAPLRFDWA
jgi:hypothetical protein